MATFEEVARTFLEAVRDDLNVFTKTKQEIVKTSDISYSLLTPDHIQWAYAGRGPGKKPPLEEMLELVRSKNILFDGMDERGTAFAIQASIGAKGTKNYKPGAPNIMETTVEKYQKKYEEDLGKSVLIDINDKVKAEFDKIWEAEERALKTYRV